MKVVSIVGARPQFIKAAAVTRALRNTPGVSEVLIHTGQHYNDNMSAIFFAELDMPTPDYQLGIGSANHGAQTGRMLEAIEQVLLHEKPDWVLVYGDTNSTLAGALAAVKLHIPVAHVEAGPRAFNRQMPEEVNRVLTDHMSDLLLAPTQAAVGNLRREGISDELICLAGDVMYDAALFYGEKADNKSHILDNLALAPKSYILATVHRAENTDNPSKLRAILDGLVRVATDWSVVFPLHPRTRNALEREGMLALAESRLRIIPPVGYLDMAMLEKNAQLVASDSGGVPKEAYFYGVPSVILRKEAVWVELVELGWALPVEPLSGLAIESALRVHLRAEGSRLGQPYGDGRAAEKIVQRMIQGHLGRTSVRGV